MIVFDLKCSRLNHVFEGWFASSDDFETQRGNGLLCCPVCGDDSVEKAVMAPAVPAKSNQRAMAAAEESDGKGNDSADAASDEGGGKDTVPMSTGLPTEQTEKLMQVLAKAQAEALTKSEWVGRKFADQARSMHYGEEDQKAIHGEVAPEEARALIDEGVEVAPLLFPVVPPKAQN